ALAAFARRCAAGLARQPVHESLPPRAVRSDSDLADAASRPLHGRVSRGTLANDISRTLQEPIVVRRGDHYGRQSAGRRCGDHFSDLLPMLEPMGIELEFAHGEGPVIHNPVREAADVDRVLELETVDALDFVMETVRQTRAGLDAAIPLIGFAG